MSNALADYLLRFADEAAFQAWSPPVGAKLNPVTAYTAIAVADDEGMPVSPAVYADGYWVQVFIEEKTDAIRDMPECVAHGYRSNGWRRDISPQLGIVAVDGLWMGSEIAVE